MTTIKDYYDKLNKARSSMEIPEWNKTIWIGPLTYAQYQKIKTAEDVADSERALAILEVCAKNEKGEPAFGADEMRDVRLYGIPVVVTRVANEIMAKVSEFNPREDETGN